MTAQAERYGISAVAGEIFVAAVRTAACWKPSRLVPKAVGLALGADYRHP